MDLLTHIAEDEEGCLRERLGDAELARQIAEADNRTAAALLLRANDLIFAIVLWRQRTGCDLKTAMCAVDAISDAIKRGDDITPD